MSTQNGNGSTTPYLVTLAVMVALTLGGIAWVFSLGGTEATARVGIVATVTTPIIAMLVVIIQTKALQAQVVAQHVATQATVARAAAETRAEVQAVDLKLEKVAEQTDGKLNALMAATAGQAAAEGQLRGMEAARATAATELESRATAAALVVAHTPSSVRPFDTLAGVPTKVEVSNPSVPVHITEEETRAIADKVADRSAEDNKKRGG